MKFDDATACLEALGNPTRLKVYRMLARSADGMPVGRLQDRLDVAASTLSHHLKSLVAAGLVSQTRDGTSLICRADRTRLRDLVGYLAEER